MSDVPRQPGMPNLGIAREVVGLLLIVAGFIGLTSVFWLVSPLAFAAWCSVASASLGAVLVVRRA